MIPPTHSYFVSTVVILVCFHTPVILLTTLSVIFGRVKFLIEHYNLFLVKKRKLDADET